jgi:hypothetical protein
MRLGGSGAQRGGDVHDLGEFFARSPRLARICRVHVEAIGALRRKCDADCHELAVFLRDCSVGATDGLVEGDESLKALRIELPQLANMREVGMFMIIAHDVLLHRSRPHLGPERIAVGVDVLR